MRDEFDADDDENGEDTPLEQWGRDGVFEKAMMAVRPAAICFLVLGFIGIFYGIYQFIAYAKFDQQWDLQIQMQQANAGVPGPQQQRMADMMDSMKGPMKAFMLFAGVSCTVVALLMILTGVLLLKLRGRTMVYVGAIVSLLPVTYCCMGGLPLGIWTLVILSRRDVKAGFRIAEGKRLREPDDATTAESLEFREDETKYAISLARQRTPLPGLFLIIFGVLAFIVGASWLALALSQPDLGYEWMKKFAGMQFTQQQRDVMVKQIDARKDDYRLDKPIALAVLVLGLIASCVMVYGGVQMRRLRNYKWCVAGAICAIATLHGCSIFALPFGLWALIALSNIYVRHAFNCPPREE